MSSALFSVTPRDEAVASLRIATDDDPYLGPSWADGFASAIHELGGNGSLRAVVLEGADRHFSAGATRDALADASARGALPEYAGRAARALLDLPVPTIAAARGHAVGGGLLLALWCDAVVLADESLYGANFMQLGLTPGMGATHVIPQAFGEPLGRELLYSGRMLTGREIQEARCPLSHAVRPRGEVLERALALAREIAEAPREAIVLLKRNVASRRRERLERALRTEDAAHRRLFEHPALAEEIARRYPAGPTPERGDVS
ncbi:MAG: enoyl-CoA hydratase-related protein [Gemmatimonadota bacterium]